MIDSISLRHACFRVNVPLAFVLSAFVVFAGACAVCGQEAPAEPVATDSNQDLLDLKTTGKNIEAIDPEDRAIEASTLIEYLHDNDRTVAKHEGRELVVSGIVVEKYESAYSLILRGPVNSEGDDTWVSVALGLPYREIAPNIELGDRVIAVGKLALFDSVEVVLWYGNVLKVDKENRDRSKIVSMFEQKVDADQIQPTMKEFLKSCRGDIDLLESAIQRFASDVMKNPDRLEMFSLANPVVRQKKQHGDLTCYYVEFVNDETGTKIFAKFCWFNDQLNYIRFLTYR